MFIISLTSIQMLDSNNNLVTNSDNNVQELISINKFIILSIFTCGLYPFWWTYKAWRFFNEKDDLDIIPAARTLFSYIFLSNLFKIILELARNAGYSKTFHPALLHVIYVVIILLSYLPEPYFLISLLSFVIFIQPFQALNFAKMNIPGIVTIERTSFNARQIVLIVIGSLLLLLVLLGILLGDH